MAKGDEFGLTEDLYHQLIGRYVATIEVLSKRIFAKDQHIAILETQMAQLEAEATSEPKEGDIRYGEEGPEAPQSQGKK